MTSLGCLVTVHKVGHYDQQDDQGQCKEEGKQSVHEERLEAEEVALRDRHQWGGARRIAS